MTDYASPLRLFQPRQFEYGAGSAAQVGLWAESEGFRRILVLTQPAMARHIDRIGLLGQVTVFDGIHPEPDSDNLAVAVAAGVAAQPDLVVGFGGGSVMDVAKLVTVLRGNQTLADVIGPHRVAGRQNALALVPDMVALDPDLTMSVPPAVTAATGIDAMAHCVEAFTNRKAHPLIDNYARLGFGLVARYLPRAVRDGSDAEARAALLLAAYYGGICLGPVNTAAGHALAYPLGTRLKLAHGLANAVIFPHVLAFNQPVAGAKTAEIAAALGLRHDSEAALRDDAARWCADLGVEMHLSRLGASAEQLPGWAAEAHAIRRLMDNNPRDMTIDQVLDIYRAAL